MKQRAYLIQRAAEEACEGADGGGREGGRGTEEEIELEREREEGPQMRRRTYLLCLATRTALRWGNCGWPMSARSCQKGLHGILPKKIITVLSHYKRRHTDHMVLQSLHLCCNS